MTTNRSIRARVLLIVAALALLGGCRTQAHEVAPSSTWLDRVEIEELVAPIALYPDPLLAQLLPAATYPLDIVRAARFLREGGAAADVDTQDWEPCVRAIARYPEVLAQLDADLEWTELLGQAFLQQPDDVMQAIQRLRRQAQRLGNLGDSREILVLVDDGDVIRIVPADPLVLYVPIYRPAYVFHLRPPHAGAFLTFGIGLSVGLWLDLDCDWHHCWLYRPGWTWNRWREHLEFEHGRVVRGSRPFPGHVGPPPPTVWRRNQQKPTPTWTRPTRPRTYDPFRGRATSSGATRRVEPAPRPRPVTERGRTPVTRDPRQVFDPRQRQSEVERNVQRGATSRQATRTTTRATTRVPARVPVPPVKVAPPPRASTATVRPAMTGRGNTIQSGATRPVRGKK